MTESFTYDEGSYGKGRLTRMNDATGQTSYAYSAAGELVQQVNVIYGNSYTTGWTYDTAGRLTAMSYPTGLGLSYGYDAYGRLSTVSSNLGGSWATLADSFLYQPATQRRYAWRFGNNLPRTVTLDTDGRITSLAGSGLHSVGFGYNNVDLLTSRNDAVYASLSATYGYDPVDRLASVSGSDAQGFGYDKVGNRTAQSRQGSGYGVTIAGSSNRLSAWSAPGLSRSFTYDASGNVRSESRSDGSRSYSYDAFDRFTGVTINGNFTGDYRNNALNQRAYRGVAGTGTGYGYGPSGELMFEVGPTTTSYVWVGGELLGIHRAGQFYASHNDQTGRPEVMSSASGAVAWRAANSAFERTIAVDNIGGMNVGFPGQYFDYETGLWNNWNRVYDGQIGRYLQSDPIGLAGGINPYAYVGGNPLSLTDSMGLANSAATSWMTGRTPTGPDFVGVSISGPVISYGLTISKSGRVFASVGSGGLKPTASVSVFAGKMCERSTGDQVDSFLSGFSTQIGYGMLGIGGASIYSSGQSAQQINFGVGISAPGGSLGYSWDLGNPLGN